MNSYKRIALLSTLVATALISHGTVYFQNTGTTSGWSKVYAQQIGRVYQVTSPTWNGGTALAFEQTWNNVLTGYHSEAIKAKAQSNGTDRYYGKVLRLPSNWVWHNKNDTHTQFSPENPEGPWRLVWVQNNHLWTQSVSGNKDLGAISSNAWIRIVFRLKLNSSTGAYEVWVNGTKKLSQVNIKQTVPGTTLRWSNGIYCTNWRTVAPPAGDATQRTIYQDHFRITSTYNQANPSGW